MITVVQAGTYSFIGEWNPVTKIMATPRVMQTRQVSASESRLVMATIIGNPKEIQIHIATVSYEPDKEIADYYRTEVTGIQLVQSVDTMRRT
jgi:hypothetical protein